MINKQFAVVRFFRSDGNGKSGFRYAHDVDCSDLSEFGMYMDKGLLALYGTDIDQIIPQMDRVSKYVIVSCPKDKRVDDAVAKLGNALWVDPEAVKDEQWYCVPPAHYQEKPLFKKLGGGEPEVVEFAEPKPNPKAKTKAAPKKKRAHKKDGTFKADDPATPENEAFEDDKK